MDHALQLQWLQKSIYYVISARIVYASRCCCRINPLIEEFWPAALIWAGSISMQD